MANPTSNFGWQMPTPTDLVTDLPADFEVFGQAVDTALADLQGGTTGQVLAKNSNTSMDFVWITNDVGDITAVTAGTGISGGGTSGDVTITNTMATAIDAKGDLVAGTGADAFTRIAAGSNGESLVADSSTATGLRWQGNFAAGKNAIINGAMDFFQRSSTPTTGLALTGGGYLLDRWAGYRAVAGSTCSRQVTNDATNLPFIQYCARVQRDSGNTSTSNISIGQSIETSNTIPYVGRIVTVSFYARAGANFSATSSTLGIRLLSSTSVDTSIILNGGTSVITSTATLSTTWQRFTFTSASAVGTNANTLGILFDYTPVGTAGVSDFFEVTGVQLEIGSVATTFTRAGGTIQGELAACQRYFQRFASTDTGANPGTFGFFMVNTYSTTDGYGVIHLPVTLRTVPTLTTTGTASNYRVYQGSGGFFTLTALVLQKGGQNQCLIAFSSTGMAANGGGWVAPDAANNGFLSFSAEL